MIKNLLKLYLYESFTFISCIILAIIASILDLKLVTSIIGIFSFLILIVWFFTSRIIFKLLLDGKFEDEVIGKEKVIIRDERNIKKNQ